VHVVHHLCPFLSKSECVENIQKGNFTKPSRSHSVGHMRSGTRNKADIRLRMLHAILVAITKWDLTQIFVQSPSFYFTFCNYCKLTEAATFSQSSALCVISVSACGYGSHLKSSREIHIDLVASKVILKFTPWFVTIVHVVKI
jgi:hypothetical protein